MAQKKKILDFLVFSFIKDINQCLCKTILLLKYIQSTFNIFLIMLIQTMSMVGKKIHDFIEV